MRIVFLLTFVLLSAVSIAQKKKTSPAAEAKPATNIESYFRSLQWRNIGPHRGGRSVASSGVRGQDQIYYMGTTGGGVWKTINAGQSWFNISDGYFKTGSIGAIAVSESDPNVIYVGAGEHAPRGVMTSYGDGVYKSTDAGKTWKKIGLDLTRHISGIRIHPQNPEIVYVAAQGALHGPTADRGVYKSTNGGATWERILYVDENTGCAELSMDMNNPRILYAAMWDHRRLPWEVRSGGPGSGLYKSTDEGKTWSKLTAGLPDKMGKMSIAVSRANPEKVYALVESDTEKDMGGLFVSTDGGAHFSVASKDHRLTQRAWYYIEVFLDPKDENTLYVFSSPGLMSKDGGRTWTNIRGTHGDYHHLWINPDNPKNMVVSNDGGGAVSFDQAKTWTSQDNQPTAQFYRVNADDLFPYNVYA
ncbi:MAG: WD40/YVTN/BNR-like repeat-containing protein, partial [Sphingobacteriales bacterium]